MRVINLPAAPDITETKGFTKLKRNEERCHAASSPSTLAQTCMWEVPVSNLGRDSYCHGEGSWISLVPPSN